MSDDDVSRDEVKALIATGIIASILAYVLLKTTVATTHFAFSIFFDTPDNWHMVVGFNFDFLWLLATFSLFLASLAFIYALDFFRPWGWRGAHWKKRIGNLFRRFADGLFFAGVLGLVSLFVFVAARYLENALCILHTLGFC